MITYLYRDYSNWNIWNRAVIIGEMTEEQQAMILSCLKDGVNFTPCAVGLPEEKFETETEDDVPWFELYPGFAEPTELPWTENMSADELVANFIAVKGHWNTYRKESEGEKVDV